jgi:hypothetical protein
VSYLVMFVADRAQDRHADALRAVAREVAGAGFFDDPDAGTERTVGTYVRAEGLTDPAARALVAAVIALSERLAVRVEVQHREVVLGHIDAGVADARLSAALGRSPAS